ncbi:MAG: metallophosphoesterase [Thermoplasmata archaeon]|nr:metallophosphoesterase [Thermoplasmata archaeon]
MLLRSVMIACMLLAVFPMGMSHTGETPENGNAKPETTNSSPYPQLSSAYTVLVHLDYFICDPDLDPWIAGDPDPYFVVHVDEQYVTTAVYDGTDEVYLNLNLTFTVYPKNPVVLIRIDAWDDDTGLTLGDDEIDIDPNTGTALDLWYNLLTKTWCGDTNTTLATGDSADYWGKLAFYIDSDIVTPLAHGEVRLSYLNTENVFIDGIWKSTFKNLVKDYPFSVTNGQILTFNFSTSAGLSVNATIYSGTQTIVSSTFTGFWQTSFYATPGTYGVRITCIGGSGVIETGFDTGVYRAIPSSQITVVAAGNVELMAKGNNFLMLRMYGFNGKVTITNTGSSSGIAFLALRNLEPDMFEFSNATIVAVGKNTVLLSASLSAGQTRVVAITPWYMPEDYWYVFMSDSQPPFAIPPGGHVEQSAHFLNIINQTNIVNPPFILHAGDFVDGLGTMDEDHMYGTGYTSPVNDYEYGELMEALGYLQNFLGAAVGNHDVSRGHIQGLGEAHYREWIGPLYYSFDYGNLHAILLDTYEDQDAWWFVGDTGMYGGYIYGNQKNWLYTDIASAAKPIKVTVMHHSLALPPNPNSGWSVNETFLNRSNALEVFRLFSGNISQVYCGHIHDYCVYNLTATANDVISTGAPGVPCIMAGNAGGDLDNQYFPYYGFVMVHVNATQILEHRFIREDQFGLSVTYNVSNDGSASAIRADIVNTGITIPSVRLKFVVSGGYEQYMAYSLTRNTQLPVFARNYGNYTVVYVNVESQGGTTESIVVSPLKGINIDMPRTVAVLPNSTVLIAHNLTNTGCIGEDVKLNVSGNLTAWNVSTVDQYGNTISEIYIPAQATVMVYVKVVVPGNASEGEVCGIILNASVKDMPWLYSVVRDEAHCVHVLAEFPPFLQPLFAAVSLILVFRKFYSVGRYRRNHGHKEL